MKRGSWRVGQGALLAIMAFGTAMPALAQQVDVGAPPPPADELNKPKPDATQADAGSGPRADTQRRARSHMLHPRDPSPSSLAGDTQSAPPPGLIGDWQDIRTRMGERGIGLSARYASETAYNFTGGDRNLVAETGQFDFGALLDLGKLVGWGGHPRVTQDAYAAIYTVTDGVPRRVNALMSRALLLGAVDRLGEIDGQVVNAVAADMGLDNDIEAAGARPSVPDTLGEEGVSSAGPPSVGSSDAENFDYASFTEIEAEGSRTPGPASDTLDLHRVRDELEDLRRTITSTAALGGDVQAIYERLGDLERRVHSVEEQTEEQEAALRRVLTLLVEWVETEDNGARAA